MRLLSPIDDMSYLPGPVDQALGEIQGAGVGPGYTLKGLAVQPEQRLSLQRHRRRASEASNVGR